MTRHILTGVAMAILLFCAPPAGADEPYGKSGVHGQGYGGHGYGKRGHHGGTGHYLRHLLMHQKEIGLTEEQVTRLKTIQLELDKTRIRTEAEVQVAERELQALVHDGKSELPAIEAKLRQSGGLAVDLRLAAIKARREAMSLLSPEQREKEQAEHEKMMKKMREHRRGDKEGKGHGMKPGSHDSPPAKGVPKKGADKN